MKYLLYILIVILALLTACSKDINTDSSLNTQHEPEPVIESPSDAVQDPIQAVEGKENEKLTTPVTEDEVEMPVFAEEDYEMSLELTYQILTVGADESEIGLTFRSTEYPLEVYLLQDGKIIATVETDVSSWQFDNRTFYTHRVSFDHLSADTFYEYVVIDASRRSEAFSFKSISKTPKMLFLGDIQGYKASQYQAFKETVEEAIKAQGPFDFIYIAGDIVDTSDSLDQWDYFFESLEELKDQIFVTAVGNHDVYKTDILYENAFNYPNNGLIGHRHFYFEVGETIFLLFDTEYFEGYEEQIEWMTNTSKPEKHQVVLMHRSAYPVFYNEANIRALSDDFEALEIDLVLSGHDHIYSRTSIYEDKIDYDKGVVYIVGGSGSGSKYYSQETSKDWIDVVYDDNTPVYTVLDFGDTIEIKAYAYNAPDTLIDQLEIE